MYPRFGVHFFIPKRLWRDHARFLALTALKCGKDKKMKKKMFLVKKDATKTASSDNWIVMNSYEFHLFICTPEGMKRAKDFAPLNGCDATDEIIIAECGADKAKEWRSDKDHQDYLAETNIESGYEEFHFEGQKDDHGDESSLLEKIEDPNENTEELVLLKIQVEELRTAISSLTAGECELIEKLYLTADCKTETEYAESAGLDRDQVHNMKRRVLIKLRKLMEKKS